MASGGFVGQSGAAMLHKNERVLPSSQVSDRGEASFDPSSVADGFDNSAVARDLSSKLDRLHGDLQELSKAVDMRVEIGGEAVARASADGTRNRVGDTDPTI
jgi:hypothetical protein